MVIALLNQLRAWAWLALAFLALGALYELSESFILIELKHALIEEQHLKMQQEEHDWRWRPKRKKDDA